MYERSFRNDQTRDLQLDREQDGRESQRPLADLGGASRWLADVQMSRLGSFAVSDEQSVQRAAATGIEGSSRPLPHLDRIQASFGADHDLGGVRAHVGGAASSASAAMGARAYATGNDVAFAEEPDLHLAAHEAAHVVQQQHGVHLKSSVGQAGDSYEVAADAVADRVVRGESAADLLPAGGGSAGGDRAVQRYEVADVASNPGGRLSDSGKIGVDLANNALYATADKIEEANTLLKGVGEKGSYISLQKGRIQFGMGDHTLHQVQPVVAPLGQDPSNDKLRQANEKEGVDSRGETGDHYSGYKAATWSDCGRTAAAIMGADSSQNYGQASAKYRAGDEEMSAGPSNAPAWMSDQIYFQVMPKFLADPAHADFLKHGVHYDGNASNLKLPGNANEAREQYAGLTDEGKQAFDRYAVINTAANPDVGGAYVMNTESRMKDFEPMKDEDGDARPTWGYHWGGVIMKDGPDNVVMESYAVGRSPDMTADDQYQWVTRNWSFQMYGTEKEGQSFHEQHLATGTHGTHASTFATKVDK